MENNPLAIELRDASDLPSRAAAYAIIPTIVDPALYVDAARDIVGRWFTFLMRKCDFTTSTIGTLPKRRKALMSRRFFFQLVDEYASFNFSTLSTLRAVTVPGKDRPFAASYG